MKTLILYKSKYGATKKYVDMLKDELDCDIQKTDDFKKVEAEQYDCIIFAGGNLCGGRKQSMPPLLNQNISL